MAKWSLKKHILSHSEAVYNRLNSKREFDENDKNNQHFTFSIDISQLILNHNFKTQSDIDKKLKAFMDDLVQYEKTHTASKGLDKHGQKMYREINFNFKDDVLMAYHNSASDSINSQNYTVAPHFHILAHKSLKMGRGYSYLREAIEETALAHGLIFNHMEKRENTPKTDRKSSSLTWFTKRASDTNFKKAVESGYVKKQLNIFQEEYKKTGNLQYLLKGYVDLQARLKRQQIEHDLEFKLFLSEQQRKSIEILYSGNRAKIQELLTNRNDQIARAYLEHTKGFSSIIIDEIEKRSRKQIPIVDIDIKRVNIKIKQKEESKGDYTKSINHAYKEDVKTASKYARNEKEFLEVLQSLGYKNAAFKAKTLNGKRERVGFSFENKNGKTVNVYFNRIDTSIDNIRKQLVENSKKEKIEKLKDEELYSHLQNYKPRPVSKSNLLFEEIYDLRTQLDLSDFYIKELDDHIEFKAKNTFIVDEGNKILIKKAKDEDMDRNIALMVDMVEAKGWDKGDIIISGSEEFKLKVKLALSEKEIETLKKEQELYVDLSSDKSKEETDSTTETQKAEIESKDTQNTSQTTNQTKTTRRRDYV